MKQVKGVNLIRSKELPWTPLIGAMVRSTLFELGIYISPVIDMDTREGYDKAMRIVTDQIHELTNVENGFLLGAIGDFVYGFGTSHTTFFLDDFDHQTWREKILEINSLTDEECAKWHTEFIAKNLEFTFQDEMKTKLDVLDVYHMLWTLDKNSPCSVIYQKDGKWSMFS